MEKKVHTFESVWATLDRISADFDKRMAELREEAEKRNAEFQAEAERRNAEARAEAERRNAELQAEAERRNAEAEKRRAEDEKRKAEADKEYKRLCEMIGGMGNSNGAFAEEFFYNALYNGQRNLFGQHFDDVMRSSKVTFNKGYEDEYDILLVNGQAVCIVEVKYKADGSDLPKKVLRKAQTFRVNFPKYDDKAIYLALASLSFHPITEKVCKENGIAIMKQVGDTMVVSDENLKVF